MKYELLHMDCRDMLACMGDNTVDSVVTDPPYHLTSIAKRFGPGQAPAQFGTDGAYARASRGFMEQTWDGGDVAFDPALWAEIWRVLKPGGHLVAFGGTRTYHRMASAIEDGGFEIRDMLSWLYGSGFPKSHNIGGGWGTALKPACEPICLARKPLVGTVAGNVLAHGVGAINVDGCRVPVGDEQITATRNTALGIMNDDGWRPTPGVYVQQPGGRFPANVLHDGSPEVLAGFPDTTSGGTPAFRGADKGRTTYGAFGGNGATEQTVTGNTGSAARFFYCAKASKADREVGCEDLPRGPAGMVSENSGQHMTRRDEGYEVAHRANVHPTVKPTDLMRWLVRLVTPPGGLVFDPFTGSGSTGRAAILEGMRFAGAELTPEYMPIARARIDAAVNGR